MGADVVQTVSADLRATILFQQMESLSEVKTFGGREAAMGDTLEVRVIFGNGIPTSSHTAHFELG